MFSNFFKDTSEKGAGFYEGVEATRHPHEGMEDQAIIEQMPDSCLRKRAEYLLAEKEKVAAEKAALSERIAEMEMHKQELIHLRQGGN